MNYQIFTDATADLSGSMVENLPKLEIIPMRVHIGEEEFEYGPDGTITAKKFYDLQRSGKFAKTSQINPLTYESYFEPILQEGKDILYICFSSGLSGTIQSARICAEELGEKYPDRKIICIDSLCASVGEGFIVCEALKRQKEGLTIDELEEWLKGHRLNVCHWFTVDTLDHLRHGGRISTTAAVVGTALQIKPLLDVDNEGHLRPVEKLRGKKKTIVTLVNKMKQNWNSDMGNLVVIGHGDDIDSADLIKSKVLDEFENVDVHIADVGPIIGAHTGPGVLVIVFWGNNR